MTTTRTVPDEGLFERRRRALARLSPSERREGREVVVVAVGDDRLAFGSESVAEILPPGPVTALPGAAPLLGVRHVRGRLIAVGDLGDLVGIVAGTVSDDRWVVVLEGTRDPVGLLVDRVLDVAPIALSGSAPLGVPGPSPLNLATGIVDGIIVLDLDAVVTALEASTLS